MVRLGPISHKTEKFLVWIATIACVVKWIRKRTRDPEVESSNPGEYRKKKKKKRLEWG